MKCSWGGVICLKLKAWSVGVDNGVGSPGARVRGGKAVALRPDFCSECRAVRGREGEPVKRGNESLWLQMMIMMNPLAVVRARSKL